MGSQGDVAGFQRTKVKLDQDGTLWASKMKNPSILVVYFP